jgi:Ala-tRNA(Pro) deacylase
MSLLNRFLGTREEPPPPLEFYLREQAVPFSVHHHPPVYTAQRLAQVEHVPGRMVAKVVIAFADDQQMVMLCLPAPCRVNMLKLMDLLGTDNLRLAREDEFERAFPDCEVGAMPPFGNLYRMPVFVDRQLAADERIMFPAGRHTDTFEMAYADFARLVHPLVGDFC